MRPPLTSAFERVTKHLKKNGLTPEVVVYIPRGSMDDDPDETLDRAIICKERPGMFLAPDTNKCEVGFYQKGVADPELGTKTEFIQNTEACVMLDYPKALAAFINGQQAVYAKVEAAFIGKPKKAQVR